LWRHRQNTKAREREAEVVAETGYRLTRDGGSGLDGWSAA